MIRKALLGLVAALALVGNANAWYNCVLNNSTGTYDSQTRYVIPATNEWGVAVPYVSATLTAGDGNDLDEASVYITVSDGLYPFSPYFIEASAGPFYPTNGVVDSDGSLTNNLSYWNSWCCNTSHSPNWGYVSVYVILYYNGEYVQTFTFDYCVSLHTP